MVSTEGEVEEGGEKAMRHTVGQDTGVGFGQLGAGTWEGLLQALQAPWQGPHLGRGFPVAALPSLRWGSWERA